MNSVPSLSQQTELGTVSGYLIMATIGVCLFLVTLYVRTKLVTNTKDFVIANRKIGFGIGVAGLISIWTWAMAVMMSSALTFQFGLSGLFWFTVPNGLAVIAIIPFARQIRKVMPEGYTIAEFIKARFPVSAFASYVVIAGMLFGSIMEVAINLKGASLVMTYVFGVDGSYAAAASLLIVLLYSVIGGLWASMSIAALVAVLKALSAVVVIAAINQAGGPSSIWPAIAAKGDDLLSVTSWSVAAGFGITLAFGHLTASLASQEFWQIVWGLKKRDVSRTFLWAGTWFYPIPICFGALGLVAIALNVNLATDLNGDAAAVGPYLIAHLGLPSWLVVLYTVIILTCCFSVIDSAFCAFSSTSAVNIIRPLLPAHASDGVLLGLSKLSMLVAAAVAGGIVLSGANFNAIVLTTYAIRTAILVPLMMAIFWRRMTASGFILGTIGSIVIGMPIYLYVNELAGTLTIVALSGLIPGLLGLFNSDVFDYRRLAATHGDQLAETPGGTLIGETA